MKKRLPSFIIIGFISTVLVIIISTAISIYTYTSQEIKSDIAIVLGAAVWDEQPSPVFRERLNHAINLYKSGDVSKIILTGGVGKGDKLAESEVGERYIVNKGVKIDDIFKEKESKTTYQNLAMAKAVINSQLQSQLKSQLKSQDKSEFSQLMKFLIVSDPLHLKRAVLMARDLGLDAYPSATPTTRYRSFKSQMEFLARETYFYFVYLIFKI
jgi:uncharacterized SAM-binding protein YcdF (DUF218 family)